MPWNEKPNHSGDLSSKSNIELQALLKKQRDLYNICNKRLPDKGLKIELLIDRISKELNSRTTNLDAASDCLSRMTLKEHADLDDGTNDESAMIGKIINTGDTEKVYLNSYDRVIHRVHVEGSDGVSQRPKYYANRTLIQHVPIQKSIDLQNSSTDMNEIVLNNLETTSVSHNVISSTSESKEKSEEACADKSKLEQMLGGAIEMSAVIGQSCITCAVSTSTNQKSMDTGEPPKSCSTGVEGRVIHGYDDSLVDWKPNRLKTRMIDFEESFALINAQLLKQNPNIANGQADLRTYDKYQERKQEFHEEEVDEDDDCDDDKEIDFS